MILTYSQELLAEVPAARSLLPLLILNRRSHLYFPQVPPSRLVLLIGQALKWQVFALESLTPSFVSSKCIAAKPGAAAARHAVRRVPRRRRSLPLLLPPPPPPPPPPPLLMPPPLQLPALTQRTSPAPTQPKSFASAQKQSPLAPCSRLTGSSSCRAAQTDSLRYRNCNQCFLPFVFNDDIC